MIIIHDALDLNVHPLILSTSDGHHWAHMYLFEKGTPRICLPIQVYLWFYDSSNYKMLECLFCLKDIIIDDINSYPLIIHCLWSHISWDLPRKCILLLILNDQLRISLIPMLQGRWRDIFHRKSILLEVSILSKQWLRGCVTFNSKLFELVFKMKRCSSN